MSTMNLEQAADVQRKPTTTVEDIQRSAQTSSGILCVNGCGKMSHKANTCPVCLDLKITGSQFCSPTCYRENYKSHKARYHPVNAAPPKTYVCPPGTHDPFPNFKYTGSLRAVMPDVPVPKRAVPEDIPIPDYARNAKGISFAEMISRKSDRQAKILNAEEILGMRKSCKLAREVLDIAAAMIKPGVTTLEIDAVVHEETIKRKAYPSPLGYHMFPRSVCTSVNEVVCHGIPDARPLEEGDIINLDVSLFYEGFHSDLNATYPVGKVSDDHARLIRTSRKCLDEAIRICKPGVEYKELGNVIEPVATKEGFSSNRTYVGHGINQMFHPALPNVSHFANSRDTGKMKVGVTFTCEPMINMKRHEGIHWNDNWTCTTIDGGFSAQFEETILITGDGCEVLTAAPGWTLPPPDSACPPDTA